jgi:hypothetical protein
MSEISGTCQGCGASIYRQHIDSGIARYEGGKLLCSHCVIEYEQAHDGEADESFAPIEFDGGEEDEEEIKVDLSKSRIHSASTATLGRAGGWDDAKFARQLDTRAISATRCRTFHSKLSEAALDFMNNQINEWIDNNPNINIKFATSTIGIFEGKHAEPNLILTLFY